ncbi:MAG: alkane 1-monooxygenase [Pseudomonadota bacterium]
MTQTFVPPDLKNALPFWSALLVVPATAVGPLWGGVWVLAPLVFVWQASVVIDALLGSDDTALDPNQPEQNIFWHRAVTLIWPVAQTGIVFGTIAAVANSQHSSGLEITIITLGVGIATGAVGIVFAHELLHQQNRTERWFGDILMTQVLYGHFRSEHLLVHHRYVGTPKDQVTARYNEDFHRFFLRVLRGEFRSAWAAETGLLARKGLPAWHRSNPFWRYGALQAVWLGLAVLLGGWVGLAIFLGQAFVAVWQLELINYIEHYGLTRKHLGDGKYEPTGPHHSWNDNHSFTRGFLINLTRHSDHHFKPSRRFPLLQTYDPGDAPLMPYGYSAMSAMATIPPLWRRVMNPRVRSWRALHYPEIDDWAPYNAHATPMPR